MGEGVFTAPKKHGAPGGGKNKGVLKNGKWFGRGERNSRRDAEKNRQRKEASGGPPKEKKNGPLLGSKEGDFAGEK